ncbi:MAG: hypothetical protein JRI23_32270 [Deltaproteobacteria bacterium]|jgi:hypothetical protein|nr:hypothetical protein [Deltaproteobacteria bacterium]MBW2536917.1 hypothetical protein [Deltaproteobacteria bacterium]
MDQPPIYVPTGPPGVHYSSETDRPSVVVYYKAFCGFMAFVYVLVAGMGVLLLFLPTLAPSSSGPSGGEALIAGGMYIVLGIGLTIPYALGIVLGRKPWVHTYGIVMIGLTMTSCMCIPIALPLLLAWLKPEVKAWYKEAQPT